MGRTREKKGFLEVDIPYRVGVVAAEACEEKRIRKYGQSLIIKHSLKYLYRQIKARGLSF